MSDHIKEAFEQDISAKEVDYWYHWTLGNDYSLPNKPQPQVEDLVCKDIQERAKRGLKKYGRRLGDSDDDMLQHLYEELLDAANYLKKIMIDRKHMEDTLNNRK